MHQLSIYDYLVGATLVNKIKESVQRKIEKMLRYRIENISGTYENLSFHQLKF